MVSSQSETIHRKMTEIIDDLEAFGQNQKKIEQAVGKLVDGEQREPGQTFILLTEPLTSPLQSAVLRRFYSGLGQ